jgi:hypothetical protein
VAVPTILSVSPSSGHTGGKTLVVVTGTNFRPPDAPPPTGPAPTPPPSVRVRFGGLDATRVEVFSSTQLQCLTPWAADYAAPEGLVDVEVANLDADGDVVVGEVATLVDGFSYALPDLSVEGALATAMRAMLRELKRQITPNVSFTVHTDYDPVTGDLLNLANVQALPALVIGEFDVVDSERFPTLGEEDVAAGADRFATMRAPSIVELRFALIGISNDPIEILNLLETTKGFFRKNVRLVVPRDVADSAAGTIEYDLAAAFGATSRVTHAGDNSNVESFAADVRIDGVRLEGIPGAPTARPAGMPSNVPHEAVRGWGHVSADDQSAVETTVEDLPDED